MSKIDVLLEIRELKNHLSYSKNIGFFFGAGTSCALGIPDIAQLTREVEATLKDGEAKIFGIIKEDLKTSIQGRDVNIEDILNQLRSIRELTKESENKTYLDVCGRDAATLDSDICKAIYQIIISKGVERLPHYHQSVLRLVQSAESRLHQRGLHDKLRSRYREGTRDQR